MKVLERAMRKERIPKVLVRSVISQHEGAIDVKVGMHQGSVCHLFSLQLWEMLSLN